MQRLKKNSRQAPCISKRTTMRRKTVQTQTRRVKLHKSALEAKKRAAMPAQIEAAMATAAGSR
jgi:hypothetical protein